MKLTLAEYREKMRGCWLGKNIGGALGAPFEGFRKENDVSFYVQDFKQNPPANDDLDLQLVWLNAAEEAGSSVNASILGEYWLSYVVPDWVEYGAGKNNLRMGLLPPLSGYLDNTYRESCGCFIRSELWACLAPGRPETAVRYAYEDAVVDHAGDGVYAELFCAALESAAFVESDPYRLINIGLSYIPKKCGVSKAVAAAVKAYKAGKPWQEARRDVLTAAPGTFGVQNSRLCDIPDDIPVGKPGCDAAGNIGIMVIGWLYGEGDFGKSLCAAVNCGEDTDCTAATLGSILGILSGYDSIPQDWKEPLGDGISTCCINALNGGISIPRTVSELTDRIVRLLPAFLGPRAVDVLAGPDGYTVETLEGDALYCVREDEFISGINGGGKPTGPRIPELTESPFVVRQHFATFDVALDYMGEPYIQPGVPKKICLTVTDSKNNQNHQWLTLKWYADDGVAITPSRTCSFFLKTMYRDKFKMEFEIMTPNPAGPKVELLADLSVNGRHTDGIVKVTLIPRL